LQGAAGEVVLAKFLNVYPDLSDTPGKYDIYWDGYKVDVKTTHHENGHLEVSSKKKVGDASVYALVIGEFPNFRVAGWKLASGTMREDSLYTYPRTGSVVWRVSQDDLIQDWGMANV
jgi:hypothetical protein